MIGLVATAIAAVCLAAVASAQQIGNATIERRVVTGPIEREVKAIAQSGTPVWVAYQLRTVPSSRQMCPGSHVALGRTTELVVMARIDGGTVREIRNFTPECEVAAGGLTVIWLDGVSVDASAAWLASIARQANSSSEWQRRVAEPALTALALNAGAAATSALVAFARDDERSRVRGQALVWLAQRAEQTAARAIGEAIDRDPEVDVRKQAVYALSRLPADQGVPLLIQVARTNRDLAVRRQAIRYLGQSNDRRAAVFFEELLLK